MSGDKKMTRRVNGSSRKSLSLSIRFELFTMIHYLTLLPSLLTIRWLMGGFYIISQHKTLISLNLIRRMVFGRHTPMPHFPGLIQANGLRVK